MNKNVSIKVLQKPFVPSPIKVNPPFASLIYSNQDDVTGDEMSLVANWLISSGCHYIDCVGLKCSEWHDIVDAVDILRDPTAQSCYDNLA